VSDALTYLLKARPKAMGHYFAFVKDAGTRLDPKTRNLISVITKVHVQTERGFRQYLGRALREGCSPTEVIDALLMAFPALGLAKIVWAVDIILEMNIPQFSPEAMTRDPEWHDVMSASGVKDGAILRTECEGMGLFIYRKKKAFQVYDSRCPHQTTNIPQLALKGTTLTCPKHEWVFDVPSGECIKKGNSPLKRIESKVVDGRLHAYW
jgi:nitrite reductase/ring-hydroxylating ferredoxin subunit